MSAKKKHASKIAKPAPKAKAHLAHKLTKKLGAKAVSKALKKPVASAISKVFKKPVAKAVVKAVKKPAAAVAKAAVKVEKAVKQAKAEPSKFVKAVKRASAKVAQAAAAVAVKVLDADAGEKAPAFELADEKGERVSSASLAGKPYLLYFYPKDDTPGCTKEACDLRDNFGRLGKHNLRVLGVSPDSSESHARFGKKYGLPYTLLSDPEQKLANAYGVWQKKLNYGREYMGIVRSTFLVGADGLIKKAYRSVKVPGHVDAILTDAQALL